MKVLVLNCGSSSIKFQLFQMPQGESLAKGLIERIGEAESRIEQTTTQGDLLLEQRVPDHGAGLSLMSSLLIHPQCGAITSLDEVNACGHRVVHGGESRSSSIIDESLEKTIEDYSDLAPLHNPSNLTGIREARKLLPGVPHVACFDTAFHQTIPEQAYLYALPYEIQEKFRIRRYGFHGTSHKFVTQRAAELLGREQTEVNLITCHLGNGCSITAVKHGKSVDTSMGFTPLEGLVMGTRSGDFDPAILFYLLRKGFNEEELDAMVNKKSGLLGISGISNDLRDLEDKAANNARARLALEIFAYRVKKYIGSYLAVLNGCDALVFTGGIGENAVRMRSRILSNLEALGLILDEEKNAITTGVEGEIHSNSSRISIFVIPTNEELLIASETYNLVKELPQCRSAARQ